MGFFDDLKAKAQDLGSSVANDVTGYFADTAKNKVAEITAGSKPKGNLSAEEIAAGERGESDGAFLKGSNIDPAELIRAASSKVVFGMPALPLILGGLVAGYFLFKRK